jgi:hypothetical protein
MGVVDEADHGGAHRGDGGCEGQVTEHPPQGGCPCRNGVAISGEVEVCPPGAEPNHDGGQPDAEGELPEPVDERFFIENVLCRVRFTRRGHDRSLRSGSSLNSGEKLFFGRGKTFTFPGHPS